MQLLFCKAVSCIPWVQTEGKERVKNKMDQTKYIRWLEILVDTAVIALHVDYVCNYQHELSALTKAVLFYSCFTCNKVVIK